MLCVSDLKKLDEKKGEKRKETYKKLLNECYTKIKKTHCKNQRTYVYTIPYFSMDMPLINVNEALRYVTKKLKKGGFTVLNHSNNSILVHWK